MKTWLNLLISGLLLLSAFGCDKKNDINLNSNGKVALYMIESYSKIRNSSQSGYSSQIDENSVITKSLPLIYYSDLLSYDSTECIFELSDNAVKSIKNLGQSLNGKAFAIKVNDTLIYTGYFWPGYFSASCDWVVIDPCMISIGNKIQVSLGYPGLVQGQVIQDKRNDARIIRIFKEDNKLK